MTDGIPPEACASSTPLLHIFSEQQPSVIMGLCECPYADCGRSLSTRYNLKKHIESHHLHIRPFKCAQCQRSFAYKHSLKHHYLQHLGIDWDLIQRSEGLQSMVIPKLTELRSYWVERDESTLGGNGGSSCLPDISEGKRQNGPLPSFF